MRSAAFAAGLALSTVAFVALLGAEPPSSITEMCTPGYSKAHRMPYPQSNAIKHRMLPSGANIHDFELDHIVPLCLGGSNNSDNLMLQPWPEAHKKDRLEVYACRAVCHGGMDLTAARALFNDWRRGYFATFGERP